MLLIIFIENQRLTYDLWPVCRIENLPFSCFLLFRLLQIFTAQTESIMATMKKRIPPTTPAVIALCFTRAGTGNLTSSELS